MEINNNYFDQLINNDSDIEKLKNHSSGKKKVFEQENSKLDNPNGNLEDEKLKELANEFTSILMKQMFKSMRNTIPESELIDGGYAEDVFTDMLDDEISKQGAEQSGFTALGKLLYEQLRNN